MTFYRERFGHREGEFPVCEDVARRSLALPFFPEMTEGQVERVASALSSVLRAGSSRLTSATPPGMHARGRREGHLLEPGARGRASGPRGCPARCPGPGCPGRRARATRSASSSSARPTPAAAHARRRWPASPRTARTGAARAPSGRWSGTATAPRASARAGCVRSVVRRKRWARGGPLVVGHGGHRAGHLAVELGHRHHVGAGGGARRAQRAARWCARPAPGCPRSGRTSRPSSRTAAARPRPGRRRGRGARSRIPARAATLDGRFRGPARA